MLKYILNGTKSASKIIIKSESHCRCTYYLILLFRSITFNHVTEITRTSISIKVTTFETLAFKLASKIASSLVFCCSSTFKVASIVHRLRKRASIENC